MLYGNIENYSLNDYKVIKQPTEDKYSMVPLYIKGFLPQQNGSAIMLPSEITALSGSDFDVDKLYIMLPEFGISKYNMRQAREDFAKSNAAYHSIMSLFSNSQLASELNEDEDPLFEEWFKNNKENYRKQRASLYKIKYDFNLKPEENSLAARNNLIIDMMYGVLTNPDTASKILNPGGFDYQKRAAKIVSILQNSTIESLREDLKGMSSSPSQSVLETLLNITNVKVLEKLAEKNRKFINPLSPRTQVYFHQQNMTGGELIKMYANHNSNHALIQHTKLELNSAGKFVLNGKSLTSLHEIKNPEGEFISRNNAGFLAASVDNVKDQVLADINQNLFTSDASMLLSRLGYTPIEIGLLMSQPIVKNMTVYYFRNYRNGVSKDTAIKDVLSKYAKRAAVSKILSYDNYAGRKFSNEELAQYLLQNNNRSKADTIEFSRNQLAIGVLFQRIMQSADALSLVVQATRSDTPGGAAGPTIAHTMNKIQKVETLYDKMATPSFPLNNADVVKIIDSKNMSISNLRSTLNESPLPYIQAAYTCGITGTEDIFSKYFPNYTKSFKEVLTGNDDNYNGFKGFYDISKTGKLDVKTINSIYNDLLVYVMSKTKFFGNEFGEITSEDKRRNFINNFPSEFKKIVTNNEDIASLDFIKRLKVVKPSTTNPVETLVFNNVGQLSSTLKERYMRDWESLLYMKNEEAQKLALNLFRYNFYRNGFSFGANSFIHLAPTSLRLAIPEYISTLRGLLDNDDSYKEFIGQYISNHLNNRRLVPEIKTGSIKDYIVNDNKAVKEFTIDGNSPRVDLDPFIKTAITVNGTAIYDFLDYVAVKGKDDFFYYKKDEDSELNTATYYRIEPLGKVNNFLEYEYGKDVDAMNSVLSSNNNTDVNSADDSITEDNNNTDYNDEDSTDNIDDSSDESMEKQEPSADDIKGIMDIPKDAFRAVYGSELEDAPNIHSDINSIQSNDDYKDANGEPIC